MKLAALNIDYLQVSDFHLADALGTEGIAHFCETS